MDVAVAGLNPSSPNGDTPATVADAFIPLSQNWNTAPSFFWLQNTSAIVITHPKKMKKYQGNMQSSKISSNPTAHC